MWRPYRGRLVSVITTGINDADAAPMHVYCTVRIISGIHEMSVETGHADVKVFCDCQAGASSMWASCCGLLNEVMGTGAVRGQQPGFGAGAGPFRFAPSAGYSTYPPTSSGSPSLVCKACGQAFSVFRRKVGIWMPVHVNWFTDLMRRGRSRGGY